MSNIEHVIYETCRSIIVIIKIIELPKIVNDYLAWVYGCCKAYSSLGGTRKFHAVKLVGVDGNVEILDYDMIRTWRNGQSNCLCFKLKVGFFGCILNVMLCDYVFILHFHFSFSCCGWMDTL